MFTHLLPPDLENYLTESVRVLKPGGRCVASYFLTGKDIVRQAGPFTLDFKFEFPKYRTTDRAVAEAAVSYERDDIVGLHERVGMEIVEPILFGDQDVVVAAKR